MFSSGGSQKSKIYRFQPPASPWKSIEPGIDDVAFQNSENGAMITINSVCGQYQDLSLEELTKNVISGVQEPIETDHKELNVSGLPALETSVNGKADGEPVTAIFTVIRSSTCVYDVIFASRPEHSQPGAQDYRLLIGSFTENGL